MRGESVWVCEGEDCKKCGDFGSVANGAWGTMECGDDDGIQGSHVKIVAPSSYLQIAKAEVYGSSKTIFIISLPITGSMKYCPNFYLKDSRFSQKH